MSFKRSPVQNPHFKTGSTVEISPDGNGFRGSWYTGKIIRRASTKDPNKYLIEYETLFKDDSGTKPLREIVDIGQLRPLALREVQRVFRFGEKVDAFHNDGWWEGSITEECGYGKFAVYFRGTKEQIVFTEDNLRLHREWVNGEWRPALEVGEEDEKVKKDEVLKVEEKSSSKVVKEKSSEDMNVPIIEETNHIKAETEFSFSRGMEVEISSDEDGFQGAWFEATIVEAVGKEKYLVEYKTLRTEDDTDFLREEVEIAHIRPHPPETVMVDSFKYLEEVDALYNDGWWAGVICKVLPDSRYIVYFKDSIEELTFRRSELRLHQDWIAGEWISPSSWVRIR